MSPKKLHEVERLSRLIRTIAHYQSSNSPDMKIVDVGSGQGYLSRELAYSKDSAGRDGAFHILALESDEGQLQGARRREEATKTDANLHTGSVTYKTLFISDTERLADVVGEWLNQTRDVPAEGTTSRCTDSAPVIITGLHACGSLTPTVLRAFTTLSSRPRRKPQWCASSLALVGCCYNLLHPSGTS